MKKFFKSVVVTRVFRVVAFAFGTGISFMGAGNLFGIGAVQSALFGAAGAFMGLISALFFSYASKGSVPDRDFDQAINSAIESVRSKSSKDKE